jgi:hypothetical protein
MTTIKAAVADLFDRQLPVDDAVDRHYGPGFRQRTDGVWEDRSGLLQRMCDLRNSIDSISITVLHELSDGPRYAERHLVDLMHRDGGRTRLEVFVFAEHDAEGRFVWIEEITRSISPDETDAHPTETR